MISTHELILNKAFMLFIQNGYEAVTMKDLQQETGLSRGALYHHFSSKEQIFNEVIEKFYISVPTSTDIQLDINSLYGFYHGYHEHTVRVFNLLRMSMNAQDNEKEFSFFQMGLDAMKKYPGFKDKIKEINSQVRQIWEFVVHTARQNGEIETEMTDSQIASCFLYIIEGIGTRFTLEGRGAEAAQEIISIWDGFYQTIKSKNQ